MNELLKTRTSTRNRFAVKGSQQEVKERLSELYKISVEARGYDFEATDATTNAIEATAKWLTDSTSKRNLLIVGGVGTGKSTLASVIANVLYDEYGENYRTQLRQAKQADDEQGRDDILPAVIHSLDEKGWPFITMSADDLVSSRASTKEDGNELSDFRRACSAHYLVVDDIGTEPGEIRVYGTPCRPFAELVSSRYDARPAGMVITSNLPFSKFLEIYGERTHDRLRELCEVLILNGSSFRK